MAFVDKMAILGVRSYSTQEPSVIQFYSPLTLIVGSNGAGKTTVIESLRYVTTGDMPPGTKNAAFIHDPKVAGEKEVKGQVKLKFKDLGGNDCCVIRSMNSVQKLKKMETRSLEGVIQIIDKNKQKRSISSRCADLTKEMVIRLGVSKAIIENVIFCHQEESNWPLSEGKALKQKFDEIFSATRYIKALENIRNFRKEQVTTVKTYGTELSFLKQNKDKADEISGELRQAQAKTDDAKNSIRKLTERITPLELQLAEINSKATDILELEKDISNYKVTIAQVTKASESLLTNIVHVFEGSIANLERAIKDFKEESNDKEANTDQLERGFSKVQKEIESGMSEKTRLLQRKGKLEQEADMHNRNVLERDRLLREVAEKYDFSGFSRGEFSPDEVDDFLQKIKGEYQSIVEKGKSEKDELRKLISDLDKRIDNLNETKHNYKGAVKAKQDLMRDCEIKISKLKKELADIEGSSNKLENLELELNQAQRDLEDAKLTFDYAEVSKEVDGLRTDRRVLEDDLRALRAEKDKLHLNSSAQAKIDHMNKEKLEKERDIQRILKRHEDALTNMFDVQPSVESLKDKVLSFKREKEKELRNIMEKLQSLNKELASKDASKRMYQEQVKEKEAFITEFELKVSEVCGENDYNVAREKAVSDVEKFNTTLAEIGAFEKIYKKYVNQLRDIEEKESCCPLCHRKFDTSKDLYALVEELEQRLASVPDKRHQTERSLDKEKRKFDLLERLGHDKARCDSMKEQLLPLREKLSDLSKSATSLRSQLEELEEVRGLIHHEESVARDMEADVRNAHKYQFDLTDLDRKISSESSKLGDQGSGRTIQQVTRECQEKEHELESISRKIELKNKQIIDGQRHVSRLEGVVNELQSQKLSISGKMQRKSQLQEQTADLTSMCHAYEREMREAKSKLEPIEESIDGLQDQREALEVKKDKVNEETRNKLEKIKSDGNKIRERTSEISRYLKDGKEMQLQENKTDLEMLERSSLTLTRKKEEYQARINEAKEDMAKHRIKAREMEDNLAFKKMEAEIRELEDKILEAEERLRAMGGSSSLVKQRGNLQKELDEVRKENAAQEGRLKGYEDEVRRCQRELRSDMYAQAGEKHREKLIQMRTTELANQDLDKFYKALDRAVMRFHNLKMAEINKIIREYWIHAYQGKDIDTIEIRADEDESSGASSARRTFNYRVVMMKGDTPLDMRSRCSAGQKVLASIIIRLALAETFCLNCGILALDEPTTNLDADNVESLANELKKIIQTRQKQRNFQLIIISHDEEFIRSLGRQDFVDYFYKIYKENGVSKIHRRSTQDFDLE